MLLPTAVLRRVLAQVLADKTEQGHAAEGLAELLDALPDRYDDLAAFAERLATLPMRGDWPWHEPDDLDAIRGAADPTRPIDPIPVDLGRASAHARTAFLAAVSGCILGKPLEFDPTLDELREVFEPLGEFPLRGYVPAAAIPLLRHAHPQAGESTREAIAWVAPDDDINYKVLATVLLETHGTDFTREHLRNLWMFNLPIRATFGPERTVLLKAGLATFADPPVRYDPRWTTALNPGDELCGALIRVDAYGYACPGHPELAAALAWRDAGFTHRRTGVYGAMFVAAAIALAPVTADPLEIVAGALRHVPQESRFAAAAREALELVGNARDWLDGYRAVHERFREFTHCRVYQEIGTLMNTLRFADDVGHGLGLQVCQGNDTDSFGATAGSLLGAWMGPDAFDTATWIAPFRDTMHLALAMIHETSLHVWADRVAALPLRVLGDG